MLTDTYQVRQADPTHNDAKMKLAEIYEILGETRRALELVYEGMQLVLLSHPILDSTPPSHRLPQKARKSTGDPI